MIRVPIMIDLPVRMKGKWLLLNLTLET
jgi:hypothetical protein